MSELSQYSTNIADNYPKTAGSLSTERLQWVLDQVKDGKLNIQTDKIDKINYDTGNKSFPEYAEGFLEDGMKKLVPEMLSEVYVKQGMTSSQALQLAQKTAQTQLAPQVDSSITVGSMISTTMIKHYIGDETINPTTKQIVQGMMSSKDNTVQMLGNAIMSILTDLSPSDNNLQIDLESVNKN